MAFSGGVFTRLYNWVTDKNNSIKIRADRMDAEFDGIATGLSQCVLKDGSQTITGNIPMSGFKFTGLGTPSADTDSATKGYVDDNQTQFTNTTVRLASTANIDLSSALDAGSTVDSVVIAENDLILVKNQSTASQNGVYIVPAAPSAASRATGFDTWDEHVNAIINVTAGTVNAGLSFRCTNNTGGTLDTTDITFVQFGSALTLPVPPASGGTGETSLANAITALVGAATAETTVALDDLIPIHDTSGSAVDKMTPVNLLKVLNLLTEDASPDTAADFVLSYDTSASTVKKVKPSAITSGVSAADQTGMEAASSTSTYTSPGRQHFHPGHPKCWATVTVSGGTPTLAASHNITSITDTGTGILTVTIATDFSSANWSCTAMTQAVISDANGDNLRLCQIRSTSIAAGSVVLECVSIDSGAATTGTATRRDPATWHMSGLGDHA